MLLRPEGGDGILFGLVIATLADAFGLVLRLAVIEALAMLFHDFAEAAGQAIPELELDALLGLRRNGEAKGGGRKGCGGTARPREVAARAAAARMRLDIGFPVMFPRRARLPPVIAPMPAPDGVSGL
jgi:hypothetical protein